MGDAGFRVVYQFAGDGNAYPGNEYWSHGLTSSGDPAAACFSLIPWLQNPDINPAGLSGARARVIHGELGAIITGSAVESVAARSTELLQDGWTASEGVKRCAEMRASPLVALSLVALAGALWRWRAAS